MLSVEPHDSPERAVPPLLWPARAPQWSRLAMVSVIVAAATAVNSLRVLADGPTGLATPVAGFTLLVLSTYIVSGGAWRQRELWAASACALTAVAAVSLARGDGPLLSVALGVGVVGQALLTLLVWSRWPTTPGFHPVLSSLGRLLASCAAGAVVGAALAPTHAVLTGSADASVYGHWALRSTVSAFAVSLLGYHLLSPPATRLPRSPAWARIATAAATVLVLGLAEHLAPHAWVLFLLLPVGVFAAWAFSVRGAAGYVTAVSLAVVGVSVGGIGPFRDVTASERASLSRVFVLVFVFVVMALVLDRAGQQKLLSQVQREREDARAHVEMFEHMVLAISDGVLVVDDCGTVVLCNNAAREVLARLPGDQGLPWAQRPDGPLAHVIAGLTAASADVTVPGRDGAATSVFSVQAYPLQHHGRRHAVAVLRDVTPERRRAGELQRFARITAHDLRSPLSALSLWAESAQEDLRSGDPADVEHCLQRVVGAAVRMDRMITDVLDYSLASDSEMRTRPVHLGDLITSVTGAYQADHPGQLRWLQLTVDADAVVDVDPRLVGRVFDNLISNAVKYTAAGVDPQVDISVGQDTCGWVVVHVDDRGVGIPVGQEARIFEEYHRAPEHAQSRQGSGIGLAICKRVVERHGGHIRAMRRPGGGARFELTLPRWQPANSGGCSEAQRSPAVCPLAAPNIPVW
jgi:signal transduction histidine kinase